MNKDVVVLTDDNWNQEVSQSSQLVLVDFWAEWCPPCRMIAAAIDELASTYAGRVKVGKVNVDENPRVSEAFEIRSIPTLLVLRGGRVVAQQVGAVPRARLAALLESQLQPSEASSSLA